MGDFGRAQGSACCNFTMPKRKRGSISKRDAVGKSCNFTMPKRKLASSPYKPLVGSKLQLYHAKAETYTAGLKEAS